MRSVRIYYPFTHASFDFAVCGVTALFSLLLSFDVQAQILNNATNLYIGSGVEVHADGSVSNTGFVQNQGEWFVSGDWVNNNIYQGLGRLTLNGTAKQGLTNNGNSFYSLRVMSPGGVDWRDNVIIDGSLELSEGIVSVSPSSSITMATSATVAGGSPSSFVEGPMIARGTGYKFFPVGWGGGYYPVELLDVSGIDPVVEVSALEGTSSFRLADYGRVLSQVYWRQSVVSGTYTGSPVSAGYNLPAGDELSIDIFQANATNLVFSAVGNTTSDYAGDPDKITTSNVVTSAFFLVGSRVNVAPGEASFYFPTSFSPGAANPDNRSIRVYGDQLAAEDFVFVVFNRWGQTVYESRSLEEMSTTGWSGQQKGGGTLASGAYPYVLKGRRTDGQALEIKGLISIVR